MPDPTPHPNSHTLHPLLSRWVPAHSPLRAWKSLAVLMLVLVGGSQTWSWWQGQQAAQRVKALAMPGQIELYTTSTCPYCEKARQWLDGNGIPWRECNIETSATCAQIYTQLGSPGTPVVRAVERWHLGFDAAWLAEALQAQAPAQGQPKPNVDNSPRP